MKRTRNGMIKMKTEELPFHEMLQLKEINGVPVVVKIPKIYNTIKGRIYHPELALMTAAEAKELIELGGEKPFLVKKQPEEDWAEVAWVTSDREVLPDTLLLGWDKVKVRPVPPKPFRCYRCQAYGHIAEECLGTRVCAVCSGQHEYTRTCPNKPKCPACSGPHTAFDPECPVWKEEKEIAKIKKTEKMSYRDALKKRQEMKNQDQEQPREEVHQEEDQHPREEEQQEEEDLEEDDQQEEEDQQEEDQTEEEEQQATAQQEEEQEQEQKNKRKIQEESQHPGEDLQEQSLQERSGSSGGWQKATSRKKKR